LTAINRGGAATYRGVGVELYGKWMGTVVDVNMLLLLLGASIAFLIILADEKSGAPGIFRLWLGESCFLADRTTILIICGVCLYPLTLMESLHQLRYTSIAGLLALFYVFCYMLYVFLDRGPVPTSDIDYFKGGLSFWLAVTKSIILVDPDPNPNLNQACIF